MHSRRSNSTHHAADFRGMGATDLGCKGVDRAAVWPSFKLPEGDYKQLFKMLIVMTGVSTEFLHGRNGVINYTYPTKFVSLSSVHQESRSWFPFFPPLSDC